MILLNFSLATGIARSVTPGQAIRGTAFTPSNPASTAEAPATEAQVTFPHYPAHSTLI